MRITLDLGELVERGQLTAAEADRLKGLALKDTAALGSNIFFAFGAIAVALGAGFFVPTPETAILLGLVFFGTGFALRMARAVRWMVFAQIVMVIGALAVAGGVWAVTLGTAEVLVVLAVAMAGAAVAARSGLLAALAVLLIASALGSGTFYWFASYAIWVSRPAVSIVALCGLTLGLYIVSLRVPPSMERLALIGARTAILMVNVAFLVGSLFGDQELNIDKMVFIIGWALALIAFGVWAVRANRRWVVNTVAVFGALHFYTQWFENLGPSALSILGGGLLLIGFGLVLLWFNRPPRTALTAA